MRAIPATLCAWLSRTRAPAFTAKPTPRALNSWRRVIMDFPFHAFTNATVPILGLIQ
jgi:hypothetical protein